MNVVATLTVAMLVASVAIAVVRIVWADTLGDRGVALDTLTSIITCGILVWAAVAENGEYLDLALVLSLLGFLASVTIARFIERGHES
jgi:multicomponent Na+:H+ antiporter subunit F